MSSDIVINGKTQQQLERQISNPAQALLLFGPEGIGKTAVAIKIASELLKTPLSQDIPSEKCKLIQSNNSTISIEQIRDLQRYLKLRVPGDQPIRRVVIIEHAERLTTEAQNAVLKVLEEPPADTVIILTASSPAALLKTISSRLQSIAILEPSKDALMTHFGQHSSELINQAYFLSGGLPGLMQALLAEDQEHPLKQSVNKAKEILQQDTFSRLTQVDALAKQKQDAQQLCEALYRIANTALGQAVSKGDDRALKRWHLLSKATLEAKRLLDSNANTKLALTQLFLRLSI